MILAEIMHITDMVLAAMRLKELFMFWEFEIWNPPEILIHQVLDGVVLVLVEIGKMNLIG